MIDSEFDDFAKGKLGGHEVPVPAGLWDKVADGQFDQFIGNKLKDNEAPVPVGLWDKITGARFDSFIGDKLTDNAAPVPAGLWDKITAGRFDNFVGGKLSDHIAPVPSGLWDKINDGRFDKFVSDKLYNYEAPVPAGLWEKIKPEQDDDHGGLLWFRSPARAVAIALLIIGLLGGGYLWYSNRADNAGNTDGGNYVNDAQGEHPGANPSPNNNNQHLNNDQSALPSGSNANTNGEQRNNSEQQSQNDADRLNNKQGESAFDIRSGNRGKSINGETISSNGSGISGNNGNNGTINNNIHRPQQNQIITADPQLRRNRQSEESAANNPGQLTPPASMDNFGFIEPYQQNHLGRAATISTDINHEEGSLSMLDKQAIAKHYAQFKSVIICPADKGRNTDWFLEAYASPDIAFRSVSNNTASQAFMSRKDSSESMHIGYTAGIRLVKPITDNFLVKAGVQFTQMNQKYVYRTENEVKNITVVSTRTIIRGPGDTVIVRDTSVLQQIGFKNNTVINRFRSVDIPVMAGYQFGDDDLKIGLNAGVVFNLSSWYQGVMLDSTLATVPITKGSPNMIYKSKVGLGIIGSVSLVKKLGDDLHIFAEPYFRYNLSNMTTPNAPYNQKFSVGGIAVGIRLNLNRQ